MSNQNPVDVLEKSRKFVDDLNKVLSEWSDRYIEEIEPFKDDPKYKDALADLVKKFTEKILNETFDVDTSSTAKSVNHPLTRELLSKLP